MHKYKQITKILWIIFFANLAIALIKIILGSILNINSLSADGFHAVTDSASNIIGIIGIRFAAKPADKEHPYGHHKYETISSLIIGIMLFIIAINIIYNAFYWFINPVTPTITTPSLIALIITLIINIIIARVENRKGKQIGSEVLIADSIHTRSDIFISLGVLLTLTCIKFGFPAIVDPIVSMLIAIFVFHSCYEILKSSFGILIDRKAIDEQVIEKIVYNTDKNVINVHKIKSRGRNDFIYIDLHLIVAGNKTVKEAHDLSHQIQDNLKRILNNDVELNAHIEPNDKEEMCM